MRFRSDNRIVCGHDRHYFKGIPGGVDFRVGSFEACDTKVFVLTGCGYGCQKDHHDCYGNGELYVYDCRLTRKQRKRFEIALATEASDD